MQAVLFLFLFVKFNQRWISDSPPFFIVKKSPPVTFAKRLFCKNGFAKGKNESATTAIQEYFLFAWFYYDMEFYFVNRLLKKILSFSE